MTFDLSILIPARNEYYEEIDLLHHTVVNVLANTSDATEIIVVEDGYSPPQPLPQSSRITVIHHSKSIGQRAACNEAARVSRAKFICKLDAHCAIGPEFDTRMMAQCDYDVTLIPTQFNLNVFNWRCKRCAHEQYQDGLKPHCTKCKSQYMKKVVKWQPRGWKERDGAWSGNPKNTAWRFDSTLTFQYWGELAHRFPKEQRLTPTMSCLGACWMLHRERYWELEGMDQLAGSWGNQGVELACKSWLSGGKMMTTHDTWFAHFFRTGNFKFPYAGGGQKERAVARSKELWLYNKWPKQVYPLSWLIDKFSPVPDWDIEGNPVRAAVNEEGARFHSKFSSIPHVSGVRTNLTSSLAPNADGKQMALDAMGFVPVNHGNDLRASTDVQPVISNENHVSGVAARLIVANDVIQNRNPSSTSARNRLDKPSVHEPVGQLATLAVLDLPVPASVVHSCPNPAVQRATPNDTGEETGQPFGVDMVDDEQVGHGLTIPRKSSVGYLYYTCNSHDITLELAARNNLLRHKNGYELGCVSRERTEFGDWNIVVNQERSGATMHYQILEGLERMRSDYVFLCESDLLYHESHFQFRPLSDSVFFYNTNVWRVRYADGHAVRTANLQQVSGICASRKLLLAHYRRRVELIRANGGVFDTKRMAYEPGTRGKFGDEQVANWESPYPNIDITGHGQTLTTPHFSIDSFRNPKYAIGWQETDDEIAGWPKLSNGGLRRLLEELANAVR